MLAQAIASVFSSQGVLMPQRVRHVSPYSDEKSVKAASFIQEASVVELSQAGRQFSAVEPVVRGEEKEERQGKELFDGSGIDKLTEEEKREVEKLKERDREVRQHEHAHVAAAGQYARGGPQFEYTTGPDNKQYATGGQVNIDTSPEQSPEATIQKAQVVKRAALAPGDPSGADRNIAAKAQDMENQARAELTAKRRQESPRNETMLSYGRMGGTGDIGAIINLAA